MKNINNLKTNVKKVDLPNSPTKDQSFIPSTKKPAKLEKSQTSIVT